MNEKLLELVRRHGLREVIVSLAEVCFEQAMEVRKTQGPEGARDWVKAANYIMGTATNVNITNTFDL